MWTIIKFKNNNFKILQENLKKKLGKDIKFYCPKYQIKKFQKNKLVSKTYNFLGDYMFCFHDNFKNSDTLSNLKFVKGLKYFLNGFCNSQNEIENFITYCKTLENSNGYVEFTTNNLKLENYYEFVSGPLAEKIFKLIDIQKNKIKILVGSVKVSLDKTSYSFKAV